MNVLIIENDSITNLLLQEKLTAWGHQVICAHNDFEAWELLKKNSIQVVIYHLPMQNTDNTASFRQILNKFQVKSNVYTIVLIGKEDTNYLLKELEVGADDYLINPVDLAELKIRLTIAARMITLEQTLTREKNAISVLNKKLEEFKNASTRLDNNPDFVNTQNSFYDAIIRIHDCARRYHHRYGIILCDIDHFQKYNVQYGDHAGDKILKKLISPLKKSIRLSDEIFFIGNGDGNACDSQQAFPTYKEQFCFSSPKIVFILPDQDAYGSATPAERVRAAVHAQNWEHNDNSRGVITVSCGIAACINETDWQQGWEDILERANNALSQAKEAGGNCVRISEAERLMTRN